jgi:UMF1 family MFS transporter
LYDFANTIYSMNILSRYLKLYIVEDLHLADYYFDIPYAISMLLAGLLLPALGLISDYTAKKKTFLFLFTLTCCSAVGAMALVPGWAVLGLVLLFIAANFSYEAGQPFYNALLYSVADGKQARLVSGIGVAWGYVGSVFGLLMVMPFVEGNVLGFDVPFLDSGGKPAAFIPTAVIFMLFAVPVFAWVRERKVAVRPMPTLAQSYREIWRTLKQTRKYPGVLRFLIADYFVEDAVATVILNIGLVCALVLNLPEGSIDIFLIVSTVSAILGSVVVGYVARAWSLRNMIALVMTGWLIALVVFAFIDNAVVVWVLGSVVGVLLGGLWTTTRPFLAELVPRDELGKFFGLFSLTGRAAAVAGPLIWTTVVFLFQPERPAGRALAGWLSLDSDSLTALPYRVAILFLALMVLVGLILFRKVSHARGSSDG